MIINKKRKHTVQYVSNMFLRTQATVGFHSDNKTMIPRKRHFTGKGGGGGIGRQPLLYILLKIAIAQKSNSSQRHYLWRFSDDCVYIVYIKMVF